MSAVLSLLASVLWGGADFLGGTLSRRLPTLVVVAATQLLSFLVLLPVAAAAGGFGAGTGYAPWGAAAGAVGLVAVAAFYRALAAGRMGVVAPVAALGVVVPVAIGLASGDQPNALQLAGLGAAAAGVVLASGPELRGNGTGVQPVLLALVAAVGFGLVIVFVSRGSRHDVLMTLLTARGVAGLSLAPAVLVAGLVPRIDRAQGRLLFVAGTADLAANACYAYASRSGLLSVVAVLASLYPAVTTVLAWKLHGERLRPVQWIGVVGAVAGVVLIGAGGGAA